MDSPFDSNRLNAPALWLPGSKELTASADWLPSREELVTYLVDICGTRELAEMYVEEVEGEGEPARTIVFAMHSPYMAPDGIKADTDDCLRAVERAIGKSLPEDQRRELANEIWEDESRGDVPLDYLHKLISAYGIAPSESRFARAVERADQAFWATVARMFPEVETGDLDPQAAARIETAMREAVAAWLDANHPAMQSVTDAGMTDTELIAHLRDIADDQEDDLGVLLTTAADRLQGLSR